MLHSESQQVGEGAVDHARYLSVAVLDQAHLTNSLRSRKESITLREQNAFAAINSIKYRVSSVAFRESASR